MEFDIKNNLLKASVGENRLGQKNIKAAIDDSLVTQMAQKGLDMNLEAALKKKNQENQDKEKTKNKMMAAASSKNQTQDSEHDQQTNQKKIVRDPLVLLKLF